MAVFRYRMQNILNLKMKLEEQEKLVFAEARAVLDQEISKLNWLEEEKGAYEQILRIEMKESLDIQEIVRLQEGIATIKWHITEQERVVRQCEERLEEERIKLTEAVMERKIQEKLRENAFEQFKKEEEQTEQKGIDELVAYQYGTAGTSDDLIEEEGSAE